MDLSRSRRLLCLTQLGKTRGGVFPGAGFAGPVSGDFAGLADDFAHLCQGGQFAAGAHLDEQVAQGGRLNRTRDDRALAGIRGELVKDGALGPAADDVNDLDTVTSKLLRANPALGDT